MLYLFFQIWVWLLIAFVLGWVAHWFFCCNNKEQENHSSEVITPTVAPVVSDTVKPTTTVETSDKETQQNIVDGNWKPQGFTSRPDKVDDLKRIKGVGAVIEKTLHGLGVYQFDQIANWTSDNVTWVEKFIAFPGRVQRESWVDQARTLASGNITEFAKRVDKGDVNY